MSGLDHSRMFAMLEEAGAGPDDSRDNRNSIGSEVIRCTWEGQPAAAVGSTRSVNTKVGALLDLLDFQASEYPLARFVTLLVGNNGLTSHRESIDALRTLRASFTGAVDVRLLVENELGELVEEGRGATDFVSCASAARWLPMMMASEGGPPPLVIELLNAAAHPALRAYPEITAWPKWSIRLEGLRVGIADGTSGWLDVGKLGSKGAVSRQRASWMSVAGETSRIAFAVENVDETALILRRFADAWIGEIELSAVDDEHALESRILRGAVPVSTSGDIRLAQIRTDDTVNWGSQFPTQWGDVSGKTRHYLDALMRDGSTPWALELKIASSVGQYYRHGIAQAVLYRHYIRTAVPLYEWFHAQSPPLDPKACRAALVVPRFTPKQDRWRQRHSALAATFDVELIEVEHEEAAWRSQRA